MCRNITELRGLQPPATAEEITAAARQYVRKVTGLTKVPPRRSTPSRRPSARWPRRPHGLGTLPPVASHRPRCRRCAARRFRPGSRPAPRHRDRPDRRRSVSVTIDDVRELAATLPRSYEVLVRDRVKFRVGRLVYVAFSATRR